MPYISGVLDRIADMEFKELFDGISGGRLLSVTTAVADAEVTITHDLGRVPRGYIVVGADKAASVYNGITAWTSSKIYIKANVATVVLKLWVF